MIAGCSSKKKAPATEGTEKPAEMAAPAVTRPTLSRGELVAEKNGIKLSKLAGSPSFPEAKLFLKNPPFDVEVEPTSTFDFRVENYQLREQTAQDPFIANSDKGQHIHVIVDNGPYRAKYEASPQIELEPGSHVILAFLSRSYHESVKHDYVLTRVHVGEKTEATQKIKLDGSEPHLFYSRPKGTYAGKAAESILLDFFLAHTSISEEGNKVEATINGQTFLLTEWVPYVIDGLPMGESTIELRLLDADGKLVPGPFNEVERTITLKPSAE